MTTTVRDNPTESRFEIYEGDTLAGRAEYVLADGEITFTHAEVDDAFEGQGLASRLASASLAEARERDLAVLPRCRFISKYISRHPEWLDLVPDDRREEFGLAQV